MKAVYWVIIFLLISCSSQTKKHEINFLETSKAEVEKKWEEEIQKWIATRKWIEDSHRLEAVSSKIFIGGAKYCEKLEHFRPYIGVRAWSRHEFEEKWQELALSRLGLGDEVQLYLVSPGSPADNAGLKFKDVILQINGRPIKKGAKSVQDLEEALKVARVGEPVRFTLRRGADHHEVSVTPSLACKGQVVLTEDDSINTSADDENIKIFKGLMRFFEHDNEIAAVISHELAHNLGKHHRQKKLYSIFFGFLGATVGVGADVGVFALTGSESTAFTESFTELGAEVGGLIGRTKSEQQADHIGLHLMAMGGYEVEQAPGFWRRVANIGRSAAMDMLTDHPISDTRILEMESTVKGIKEKIHGGLLVIPD